MIRLEFVKQKKNKNFLKEGKKKFNGRKVQKIAKC